MSSGTIISQNISTSIYSSSSSTAVPTPPSLKRVNTPPNLRLSCLMSGDASVPTAVNRHRRTQSFITKPVEMNSENGDGLAMGSVVRPATSASAMSALQMDKEFIRSPCFVHKTFGDSLNIERVMNECRAEEMTHHNLLQTATGVREVARQLGLSFWIQCLYLGRTVVKTKIKSVMIVTKARDHALVQLTRDLALWLMTTPRYGNEYGVSVHVDAKLEKSKRFDAEGLVSEQPVIQEKNLLKYWTPETCVYADSYDFVITVRHRLNELIISSEETALCFTHHGCSSRLSRQSSHSISDLLAF
jgi:hypothetical protein